jgi:carbamoyl-phosphate synthase large subunit
MRAIESEVLTVFASDLDPYAAGLYLVPAAQRTILPRGDDPAFTDLLFAYCERERIDVIVPTVDSELLPLALERRRFEEAGVALVLASQDTLGVCLDGWALHARCRDRVRVPASWLVDDEFDVESPELPVIVKARSAGESRDIRLVETREGLDALERDGTLLVQEYLPGAEYSLDTLGRADGEVLAVVPWARLKVDSGIAITGRTLHVPELERFGRNVAKLIDLTTVANIQVKEDVLGVPALLGVSPRFPGAIPLTVAAGVDMPSLAVEEALGAELPDGPLPFEETAMVRVFEERFFPFEQIAALEAEALENGGRA